ncbi:MAG: putative small integral rane protein [Candidatus Paceibacter sp.]|jgi:low affinity Fe/Cu permease|nr:putative small integral rane protein [Candidatus Paceibacter sp.]
MNELFRKIAHKASEIVGSANIFMFALILIIIWAMSGHYYNYSDTWQLVINTGTTILTFLMVILIQNTQNREARATQLKLDELIWGIKSARNKLIDLEDMSDEEIEKMQKEFEHIREKITARKHTNSHK